jgi:hypothetical protein
MLRPMPRTVVGGTSDTGGAPGLLATAFRDRRAARLLLAFLSGGEAFPVCAAGHEEAGGQDGPGPWQGGKQGEGGRGLGTLCHGRVAVGHGLPGHAELGAQGVPQEGMGGNHAVIRGQGHSVRDGLKAGRDDVGRGHVVGPQKALQGGAMREWDGFQRRPVAEEVAKDRRRFIRQPLQDVGEGVVERTRQAMGQADCIADEALAVCDAWRPSTPGGAWRDEGGELVTVCEPKLALEGGSGGVLCGPARGQRCAVRGHGERRDGTKPEAILGLQRRHHGAFLEFQADGHRLAVEPRAQGAAPRVDYCRPVCVTQKPPARRPSAW